MKKAIAFMGIVLGLVLFVSALRIPHSALAQAQDCAKVVGWFEGPGRYQQHYITPTGVTVYRFTLDPTYYRISDPVNWLGISYNSTDNTYAGGWYIGPKFGQPGPSASSGQASAQFWADVRDSIQRAYLPPAGNVPKQ